MIAEGVETREQIELLRALGCDRYQGFHFCPPVSAAAYERLMRGAGTLIPAAMAEDPAETCSRLALASPVPV